MNPVICEHVERWEKIPLPEDLDNLDEETIQKLMRRLEDAFEDGQKELSRLN